jgi:cytochrome c553
MNLLQLMRAFPFPHSNVLFDAQSIDPEGSEKSSSMAFSVYRWQDSDAYAGWTGVENSGLALAEMASLLLVSGRLCANGLPVPVEREDWKKYSQDLVRAGEAAYKAAKTRNMDAVVEVSETIAGACAACHDVYRDIDQLGKERCTIPQ